MIHIGLGQDGGKLFTTGAAENIVGTQARERIHCNMLDGSIPGLMTVGAIRSALGRYAASKTIIYKVSEPRG